MPTSDNCPVTHVKELPLGTVGSAASSLTATLCQGNPEQTLRKKKQHFNFLIVNFQFIYGNIPAAPAYRI
jgi:hypothetical protein